MGRCWGGRRRGFGMIGSEMGVGKCKSRECMILEWIFVIDHRFVGREY